MSAVRLVAPYSATGQDTNDDAADWSVTAIVTPGAPNQQSPEDCDSTVDDDFDMLIDCADPDCAAVRRDLAAVTAVCSR